MGMEKRLTIKTQRDLRDVSENTGNSFPNFAQFAQRVPRKIFTALKHSYLERRTGLCYTSILVGALLIAVIVPLSLSVTADATVLTAVDRRDSISDTRDLYLNDPRGIDVFSNGGIWYAAVASRDNDGVQIINLANINNLQAAGKIGDSDSRELDGAQDIDIFQKDGTNYAAVASYHDDGVQIISLEDPANPTAVGKIADTSSLELDGANGIDIFQKDGTNYAAVASYHDDGVQIISLEDPANPTAVGKIADTSSLELDGASGITVFSYDCRVQTPTLPTFFLPRTFWLAAVASYDDDGVQIIDITTPAAPVVKASIGDTNSRKLGGALDITHVTIPRPHTPYSDHYLAVAGDDGVQILGLNLNSLGNCSSVNITEQGKIDNDEARGIIAIKNTGTFYGTFVGLITTYHDDRVRLIVMNADDVGGDGIPGYSPSSPGIIATVHDNAHTKLDNPWGVAYFDVEGAHHIAVTARNDDAVQVYYIHYNNFHTRSWW